jgi:cytochrome c5
MAVTITTAALSVASGHSQAAPHAEQTQAEANQPRKNGQNENGGQRVFEQNCARCHRSPEGFSPRISGSIVRHMRVRVNLSEHDEQALLKFFNQ